MKILSYSQNFHRIREPENVACLFFFVLLVDQSIGSICFSWPVASVQWPVSRRSVPVTATCPVSQAKSHSQFRGQIWSPSPIPMAVLEPIAFSFPVRVEYH